VPKGDVNGTWQRASRDGARPGVRVCCRHLASAPNMNWIKQFQTLVDTKDNRTRTRRTRPARVRERVTSATLMGAELGNWCLDVRGRQTGWRCRRARWPERYLSPTGVYGLLVPDDAPERATRDVGDHLAHAHPARVCCPGRSNERAELMGGGHWAIVDSAGTSNLDSRLHRKGQRGRRR
jgi:hypothetical protein